jgi:hypothetical protein
MTVPAGATPAVSRLDARQGCGQSRAQSCG